MLRGRCTTAAATSVLVTLLRGILCQRSTNSAQPPGQGVCEGVAATQRRSPTRSRKKQTQGKRLSCAGIVEQRRCATASKLLRTVERPPRRRRRLTEAPLWRGARPCVRKAAGGGDRHLAVSHTSFYAEFRELTPPEARLQRWGTVRRLPRGRAWERYSTPLTLTALFTAL